ncbi:MAG: CCA tRNA nucleotidyltransferase [Sulfurospirillaceae bacterium]|nr:CCA tRNA nucleotidyltransferase [Sulfurospirillaceae bacterium]
MNTSKQSLLVSFSPHIDNIKEILKAHTSRAYITGGALRDVILQRDICDIDIEVYDIAPKKFDALMQSIGAKGVGKSFFVYKYGNIDLSLPRLERKVSLGHSGFEIDWCNDEKEASKRRDFSMNAMMLNIFDGMLLDFWGGMDALHSKSISLIDKERFKEDSLRVLRGVRFSACFGFKIEPKTLSVMQSIDMSDLSKTRIFWEFEKLFRADFLHYGLFYMYKLNLFKKLLHVKAQNRLFLPLALAMQRYLKNVDSSLRDYYFLYILSHYLHCLPESLLQRLEAPRRYFRALEHVPFETLHVSDFELAVIAIDIPLKDWVGVCVGDIKKRAQAMGVYSKKFGSDITSDEVIKDGFVANDIAQEIRRRKIEKAKKLFG